MIKVKVLLSRKISGVYFLALCCQILSLHSLAQQNFYNGTEKRVAFVAGVGLYQNIDPLPNPGNDANAVAESLGRLGFDVVKLIDPTYRELRDAELDFIDMLDDADVAFFYYAGHSIQLDGVNILIPVDASLDSIDEMSSKTFQLARLVNRMDRFAKTKIIVLDACRDNPFVDKLQSAAELNGRSVSRGLARISTLVEDEEIKATDFDTYGTIVSYAAAPGNVASDGQGYNSPYTAALLKRLEEPGLEVGSLFRQVAADVVRETRGAQKPEYLVKLTDEFYFLNPEPNQCDYLAIEPQNNLSIPGIEFDRIDFSRAIPACKTALENDSRHPRYAHNLARAYDVSGEHEKSISFYTIAADQGYVHAINSLGVMYVNGQGVKQDFYRGVKLLNEAKKRGHVQARVNLQGTDFSVLLQSPELEQVQSRLMELSIYDGSLSGAFDDATQQAIADYQKSNRLAINGLTLETLDHLDLISVIPNFTLN
ncbi:MAG: caspase family protein [Halioglobus sp.]